MNLRSLVSEVRTEILSVLNSETGIDLSGMTLTEIQEWFHREYLPTDGKGLKGLTKEQRDTWYFEEWLPNHKHKYDEEVEQAMEIEFVVACMNAYLYDEVYWRIPGMVKALDSLEISRNNA